MATKPYRLTFVLLLSGPTAATTQQTVTIAAKTMEEAVELARFYCASLPAATLCSAKLTDSTGTVIWSEQDSDASDEASTLKDHP